MKAVLFDLDGTLLPMDQDEFVHAYFKLLAKKLYPYGYDPKVLINSIWQGTAKMVQNDGTKTNEVVFWDEFKNIYGDNVINDIKHFEDFYANEFNQVKDMFTINPLAKEAIDFLKSNGIKIILASNPIFPLIAQHNRINWAGLNVSDFSYITCYENSSFCKPNPKYYQQILDINHLKAEDVIMVGNDVAEDMVASTIGISTFLVTDCMINKKNEDISKYNHGNFSDLLAYLKDNIK